MTTNSHDFSKLGFWGLIGGSHEVIARHPCGVQRHHGEWRLSPLDDSDSDLRDMKQLWRKWRSVIGELLFAKRVRVRKITRVGIQWSVVLEFFPQPCQTRCALWRWS